MTDKQFTILLEKILFELGPWFVAFVILSIIGMKLFDRWLAYRKENKKSSKPAAELPKPLNGTVTLQLLSTNQAGILSHLEKISVAVTDNTAAIADLKNTVTDGSGKRQLKDQEHDLRIKALEKLQGIA